jgi:hypothetical protein
MRSWWFGAVIGLGCGGCVPLTDDTNDWPGETPDAKQAGSICKEDCLRASPASVDDSTESLHVGLEAGEHLGEAASESTVNTGCRAACAVAYALGCVSVGLACAGATTITLGGTTIPCTWALIAACGVIAPSGTQICMAYCPA